MNKTGILVVSFGTSFPETRKKTIDQIEQDIRDEFTECKVYRAWTSRKIANKIFKRDGIYIPSVKEAMEQMKQDGISTVVVQPTHVINGIENDLMKQDILPFADSFEKISIGDPVLTTQEDKDYVIKAAAEEMHPAEEDALVFMGHGTEHHANSVYAALDYQFKDMGYKNIFLGTVEAYPSIETMIRQVKAYAPKKVILAPFMIVAGDHATNDLSGDDEDSWKSQFEAAGFTVECVLKGLGEYKAVRTLLVEHVKAALA